MNPILIGTLLAVAGSAVSIAGACINNLWHRHRLAMQLWMLSNLLLLAWAVGYDFGWWDGGLSGKALVAMYAVFSVTNLYGLWRYKR